MTRLQLGVALALTVCTPPACWHSAFDASSAASASTPKGFAQSSCRHLWSLQQLRGSHCQRPRQQLYAHIQAWMVVCFLALLYPVGAAGRPTAVVGLLVGAALSLRYHQPPVLPAQPLALPCAVQVHSTHFGI